MFHVLNEPFINVCVHALRRSNIGMSGLWNRHFIPFLPTPHLFFAPSHRTHSAISTWPWWLHILFPSYMNSFLNMDIINWRDLLRVEGLAQERRLPDWSRKDRRPSRAGIVQAFLQCYGEHWATNTGESLGVSPLPWFITQAKLCSMYFLCFWLDLWR